MNEINVYWSCFENSWLRSEEPEPIAKSFYKSDLYEKSTAISSCPSFTEFIKNKFSLKSIYKYEFEIKENQVFSNMYNQDFFNDHVLIRSIDKKFFSFKQSYLFFSDEKSLIMNIEPPYLENNNVNNSCIVIPGSFDIGKWFRNIDFAFYLRPDMNIFKIDEGEIFSYISFQTNKKINFIQFEPTEKLKKYSLDVSNINKFSYSKPLNEYYSKMILKKKIIEEINSNLIN